MVDMEEFKDYIEFRGRLDRLKSGLTVDSDTIEQNIDALVEKFDDRFPSDEPHRRDGAEVVIKALMDVPLSDYLIGHHSSAVVSSYATAERFFRPFVASLLADSEQSMEVIIDMLQRDTLKKYSNILLDIDIFENEDHNKARRLADIRNGIAHHNETLIANRLRSGADLGVFEAIEVARDEDSADFIFDVVHLIEKAQSQVEERS